ncbi:HEAT repeat domain-containing protein [Anaerolineales bacterium HSG6]|nr:HEAT repeat domain-containing protein [Anaerolineales bacterium HSG6]
MTTDTENFNQILDQIANRSRMKLAELYNLSKMNQSRWEMFQAEWPTMPVARRQEIMQAMVEIGESNFEVDFSPIFLIALGDADSEVRTAAIQGLWESHDPTLVTLFGQILHHDEAIKTRAAAALALSQFIYYAEIEEIDPTISPLATQALHACINNSNEDVEVRRRAVEAIAFSSDESISKIIDTAYYDEDDLMQVSAVFAMGRNADSRWISRVMEELDNPNPAMRFEAARACGELEITDALPKLINILQNDPDIEVQEIVISALGQIGGSVAREAIEDCLESEIESIVTAASDALEELAVYDEALRLFDLEGGDEDFPEIDDNNSFHVPVGWNKYANNDEQEH